MKKWLFIVLLTLIMATPVLAAPPFIGLGDDNSTNQYQGQAQGQAQTTVSEQGQTANGSVSVGGDTEKNRAYAVSYPSLSGGEGVSQANAFSVFGGVGLSGTETYKKLIIQMQAVEASQTISPEDKKDLVEHLAGRMMDTNKKQRFFGFFWETSGRNLMNLFGILAWDSFWKEDQKPFEIQKKNK